MVQLTDFGKRRFESDLSGETATLDDILRENQIETRGRRLAINGHPVTPRATVVEGDEISILPRVQGG